MVHVQYGLLRGRQGQHLSPERPLRIQDRRRGGRDHGAWSGAGRAGRRMPEPSSHKASLTCGGTCNGGHEKESPYRTPHRAASECQRIRRGLFFRLLRTVRHGRAGGFRAGCDARVRHALLGGVRLRPTARRRGGFGSGEGLPAGRHGTAPACPRAPAGGRAAPAAQPIHDVHHVLENLCRPQGASGERLRPHHPGAFRRTRGAVSPEPAQRGRLLGVGTRA